MPKLKQDLIVIEPGTHSIYSCSGADRQLACPGSVHLEAQCPDEPGEPAQIGTAKHWILAKCLQDKCTPDEYLGVALETETMTHFVTPEFIEDIEKALKYVNKIVRQDPGSILFVEETVTLDRIHPEKFGSLDIGIYQPTFQTLYVLDFKTGYTPVSADTHQLKDYAVGLIDQIKGECEIETVFLGVIQPRRGNYDELMTTPRSLFKYARWAKRRYQNADSENPEFNPGEKACRFCKGSLVCEAYQNYLFNAISNVDYPALPEVEADLKTINELSLADMSKLYRLKGSIDTFFKKIESKLVDALQAGQPLEFQKFVKGRPGNRYFTDTRDVEKFCIKKVEDPEELYTKKFKSPAQIQKLLTKEEFKKLQNYIDQKPPGLTLVDIEDPGRAVEYIDYLLDEL